MYSRSRTDSPGHSLRPSGLQCSRLAAALARHHHVAGHQSGDTAERHECPAGVFGLDHIHRGTEAGVEGFLIHWPLPACRPILQKIERLLDAVDFLDGQARAWCDAHRHLELQSVHSTSPEPASPKQRRSWSKVALSVLCHGNVSSLRKAAALLQRAKAKPARTRRPGSAFLRPRSDYWFAGSVSASKAMRTAISRT